MKHKPNESIEEWAERVSTHEYGLAVKQIAAGKDVDLVMQAMSVKILEKLKHPILTHICEWGKNKYDATLSTENYKKNYLDKTKPRADHMNDVDDLNQPLRDFFYY